MNFKDKKTIWGLVIILIIIVVLGLVMTKSDQKKGSVKETDQTGETKQDERIVVSDQNPGPNVLVDSLSVDTESWVAVHEDSFGELGNILGAYIISSGNHSSLSIPLLRGTIVDNKYHVVVYEDDGDREFDYKKDMPNKDEAGNTIYKTFRTTSLGSRGEISE